MPNRPGTVMANNEDLVAACDENTIGKSTWATGWLAGLLGGWAAGFMHHCMCCAPLQVALFFMALFSPSFLYALHEMWCKRFCVVCMCSSAARQLNCLSVCHV